MGIVSTGTQNSDAEMVSFGGSSRVNFMGPSRDDKLGDVIEVDELKQPGVEMADAAPMAPPG